jgi:dihydroneopterin aldolase
MASPEQIIISQLNVSSFIGVTEEERKRPQRLRISVWLEPGRGLSGLEDSIENTIDYFEVCSEIKVLAAQGERRLIETLAEDVLEMLFAKYPIAGAELELRKYIMPDTEYVAVRLRRGAA